MLRLGKYVWIVGFHLLIVATASGQAHTVINNIDHLRHGINIGRLPMETSAPCCTQEDVELIRAAGFDYIRVNVKPELVFDFSKPDTPETIASSGKWNSLDNVVRGFTSKDVAVVITFDLEYNFQKALLSDETLVKEFAQLWHGAAQHYSRYPSNLIFFEILNEPVLDDFKRWDTIQAILASEIRAGAPQHTIIATGAQRSIVDGFLFLTPLGDSNVAYSFHYYEPLVFTQQGGNWGIDYWRFLNGVSYPSTPESAWAAAERLPTTFAPDRLYVLHELELFTKQHIDADLQLVAQSAKERKIVVICDEFGVETNAATSDRANWITDVRSILDKYQIGWALWDYDSTSFGVVNTTGSNRTFDRWAIKALGLNASNPRTLPKQ